MWHGTPNVHVEEIKRTCLSRHAGRVWCRNLLFILTMLTKMMVEEGKLGDVFSLGKVHDVIYSKVCELLTP